MISSLNSYNFTIFLRWFFCWIHVLRDPPLENFLVKPPARIIQCRSSSILAGGNHSYRWPLKLPIEITRHKRDMFLELPTDNLSRPDRWSKFLQINLLWHRQMWHHANHKKLLGLTTKTIFELISNTPAIFYTDLTALPLKNVQMQVIDAIHGASESQLICLLWKIVWLELQENLQDTDTIFLACFPFIQFCVGLLLVLLFAEYNHGSNF